jgi:hypothetical protein
MLVKHMTPLSKGGQRVKHAGKGASPFPPQPKPGPLTEGAPSMNNYAKATPMPTTPAPTPPMGVGPPPMGGTSPGQAQGGI